MQEVYPAPAPVEDGLGAVTTDDPTQEAGVPVSDLAQLVYEALVAASPQPGDQLTVTCGCDRAGLHEALLELESAGVLDRMPGDLYGVKPQ